MGNLKLTIADSRTGILKTKWRAFNKKFFDSKLQEPVLILMKDVPINKVRTLGLWVERQNTLKINPTSQAVRE